MKTRTLLLAALTAFFTLPALADSPEAILKDYRARATQATLRLNETLEKQSSPVITDLLRKNDTAGAAAVTAQVKAKLAGEPVATPHVAIAALFAQYDGARATALQPVQKASLARLDSLLNVPGGPKTEELASLTKAKTEVETGLIAANFDWKKTWNIHYGGKNSPKSGSVVFNADGTAIYTSKVGNKTPGKWQPTNKANSIQVDFPQDAWLITNKQTGIELHSKALTVAAYLTPME